ncbi:MAG: hypothetical protein H7Y62_13055 [Hyphomicrobium sp.]|nr:hypothetical protein [Hyphomicrobium sp.]
MTAYVTAVLQNLLQRSLALPIGGPPAGVSAPLACNPADAADTPMLYRSEAFAEDLFDSHPAR